MDQGIFFNIYMFSEKVTGCSLFRNLWNFFQIFEVFFWKYVLPRWLTLLIYKIEQLMFHEFYPIWEFMEICLWDFLLVCQSQAYYTFWKHFLKNSTTINLRSKYVYKLKAGISGILLYFGMFGDMNLRCSIFEPKSKFFDFFLYLVIIWERLVLRIEWCNLIVIVGKLKFQAFQPWYFSLLKLFLTHVYIVSKCDDKNY